MEKTIQGFSVIELLVTIAIAGILSAIAIPSYATLMANSRASTYANQLVSDLRYARSIAILNNQATWLCQPRSSSSTQCNSTATWQKGWSVLSRNAAGNMVIRRHFQFNSQFTTVSHSGISISGESNYLNFQGNGMPSPLPTTGPYTFTITPQGCTSGYTITIPADGQITKNSIACP